MNWMEEFISRCLAGVPEGKYRARTEKELGDHLLSLRHDLEEAGYPTEEARALAVERMGDPAELARSYLREWRRRSLGLRALAEAEILLVGLCIAVMSVLYATNTRNFGKQYPAHWGIVATLAAALLLCAFLFRGWTLARLSCQVLAVIQGPPIFFWVVLQSAFEFTGVMMVPWWLGSSIHTLLLLWALGNYSLLTRFQLEDDFLIQARRST